MPLMPFNSSVSMKDEEEKPVLVFSDQTQSMGLVVDQIIDIMDERIDVQLASTQSGLLGSAIINGKATDVVDVAHYLKNVNNNWFKDHNDTPFGAKGKEGAERMRAKRRVLIVDDSPFFRNMLMPVLSVAGYDVTATESPYEAFDLCESGADFDAIISDIEMPEMDGFEFAKRIKSGSRWSQIPMVALSSHATPQDMERGREVGFNSYVAKFDKDALLNTLSKTIFG